MFTPIHHATPARNGVNNGMRRRLPLKFPVERGGAYKGVRGNRGAAEGLQRDRQPSAERLGRGGGHRFLPAGPSYPILLCLRFFHTSDRQIMM